MQRVVKNCREIEQALIAVGGIGNNIPKETLKKLKRDHYPYMLDCYEIAKKRATILLNNIELAIKGEQKDQRIKEDLFDNIECQKP